MVGVRGGMLDYPHEAGHDGGEVSRRGHWVMTRFGLLLTKPSIVAKLSSSGIRSGGFVGCHVSISKSRIGKE
ncbi:MAG TPA: hypothetical protein ENK61_03175 [Devosia sp.]|nr:hypothetical protein [Devosia sp.]